MRGDAVLAKGVLVDVHDLSLAQAHGRGAFVEIERDHVAGGGRARGVHGGVDLDTGRHADHGHALADSVADVARGAVAAGEEDEVDAGGQQLAGRLLGVGRRRQHEVATAPRAAPRRRVRARDRHVGPAPLERAQHARLEAGRAGLVLPHLARPGDQLDVVAQASQARERQARAARSVAHGAELERGASISAPSLPLRPTRPPTPATGLTMRPSFLTPLRGRVLRAARGIRRGGVHVRFLPPRLWRPDATATLPALEPRTVARPWPEPARAGGFDTVKR